MFKGKVLYMQVLQKVMEEGIILLEKRINYFKYDQYWLICVFYMMYLIFFVLVMEIQILEKKIQIRKKVIFIK